MPLHNISHPQTCMTSRIRSFLLRSLDVKIKVIGGGEVVYEFRGPDLLLAYPLGDRCQGEIYAILERLAVKGALLVCRSCLFACAR